jgi:hypothetical protein
MFDVQEGSILDPYAFTPKPKKPEKYYRRPEKPINWKPLTKGVKQLGSGTMSLFAKYKKQRQQAKQEKDLKLKELKNKAKSSFNSLFSTSQYGFSRKQINLPKAEEQRMSASEEGKQRFEGNIKLYRTDKEKFEKK